MPLEVNIMSQAKKRPWYIDKGCLLITVGLFVTLSIYVLLTPVVLCAATLYARLRKNRDMKILATKGVAAFWLTDEERKEFAALHARLAGQRPRAAPLENQAGSDAAAAQASPMQDRAAPAQGPAATPETQGMLGSTQGTPDAAPDVAPDAAPDAALAEAEQRYQDLCVLPRRRRARFVRHYGAAYGAPAGLIAWLVSLVLYSFEFNKGVFESFAFYFHFPVRIITRTMLAGELEFVLSMSTTALAVAVIAGGLAGLMAMRLAPRPESVTLENYLRHGN